MKFHWLKKLLTSCDYLLLSFADWFCHLSPTDSGTVAREEEAIKLDGLSVAQMKELKDKSEKHVFQAEVNRMMKLIINSLYKNKEVCLKSLFFIFTFRF